MNFKVFWDVMIRHWVDIYRRFEESLCSYLQELSCEKFKPRNDNQNWRTKRSFQDSIRSYMLPSGVGLMKK